MNDRFKKIELDDIVVPENDRFKYLETEESTTSCLCEYQEIDYEKEELRSDEEMMQGASEKEWREGLDQKFVEPRILESTAATYRIPSDVTVAVGYFFNIGDTCTSI